MSDFEAITGIPIEAILGPTERLVVVKRCPSCDEPVEPGWTFCGCGADLPVERCNHEVRMFFNGENCELPLGHDGEHRNGNSAWGEMDGYEPSDSHSGPFKRLDQYQSQLRAKRKRVKR